MMETASTPVAGGVEASPTSTTMPATEKVFTPVPAVEEHAEGVFHLVPIAWQVGLLAIAILCACLALFLRWNSQQEFKKKNREKL